MTLAIKGLGFAYRRDEPVFTRLDHHFAPGTITAVTGPSGRGKSTFLALIGLLLTPSEGDVIMNGRSTAGLGDGERSMMRASHYGFVFQDACLDPTRSVLDNVLEPVAYARGRVGDHRARAEALLHDVGVDGTASRRPGEVSGGQAQRVALCRALVNDPAVVLADEPTGNLDPAAGSVILDVLAAAAQQGKTVVIATHAPDVVERADEELVL